MEILVDDKEERVIRFQSGCHEPGCAIDIYETMNSAPRFLEIEFYATPARWRDRLRWRWRMLTQGVGFEHEFIVRPEDIKDLVRVIAGESPLRE